MFPVVETFPRNGPSLRCLIHCVSVSVWYWQVLHGVIVNVLLIPVCYCVSQSCAYDCWVWVGVLVSVLLNSVCYCVSQSGVYGWGGFPCQSPWQATSFFPHLGSNSPQFYPPSWWRWWGWLVIGDHSDDQSGDDSLVSIFLMMKLLKHALFFNWWHSFQLFWWHYWWW